MKIPENKSSKFKSEIPWKTPDPDKSWQILKHFGIPQQRNNNQKLNGGVEGGVEGGILKNPTEMDP